MIRALPLLLLLIACSAPAELTVMSYNIRYGTAPDGEHAWPKRRRLAIGVVEDRRPDIVGMQEVLEFQRREFLDALPGYEAVGRGRDADGGGEQSCILYRADRLTLRAHGTFWLSESPDVAGSKSWDAALPRICTWAEFEFRGRRFTVYNTHFDHRGATARLESARMLAARVRGPAIVTGDFNNPPMREFAAWTDALAGTTGGTFHGFRGGDGGERIDGIFVEGFGVVEAAIVRDAYEGRYPSDHYPVTARVRFGSD